MQPAYPILLMNSQLERTTFCPQSIFPALLHDVLWALRKVLDGSWCLNQGVSWFIVAEHHHLWMSASGFFLSYSYLFSISSEHRKHMTQSEYLWHAVEKQEPLFCTHLITGVHNFGKASCLGPTWMRYFYSAVKPDWYSSVNHRGFKIFQQPFPNQSPCKKVQLATLLHLRGKLALGTNKASNWFNLKFQTSVCCSASDCHLLFQLAMTESTFFSMFVQAGPSVQY